MATTKFYLDQRRAKADGTYPLKLMINVGVKTTLLPLGIYLQPKHWNAGAMIVVGRNDRQLINTHIAQRKQEVDLALLSLQQSGRLPHLSPVELKRYLERPEHGNSFAEHYLTFTNQHHGRTREIYQATYNHLERYAPSLMALSFEDITKSWLTDFDNYLMQYSPARNARNIHLRNIRAVFNDAIDNGITSCYPFRKFSIKNEPTAHRALPVDELRTLFNYPCEPWQQQYLDMYKLIFFLCGINIIDLFSLKGITRGRVEYRRAKTHKLYSIKVEPEALHIINMYKGKKALLNMADRYNNYKDYAQRLNNNIQRFGDYKRVGRGGKKVYTPLFPDITSYWMRHTWATIAAELDIPKETIAACLGHEMGNRTTAIYIQFDQVKIDEANRKVLDYVLYNKK